MYKTIRHGENSLQYTILPQNDDFRIEGKLSSAGSSCSSGSGRKSKAKRPRRRSFFAYLGLIFVCTVIVGALLIPFLVSAERLPSPTEWFTKTKAALTKSNAGADGGSSGAGGGGGVSGNGVNVGKIIKIISKNGAARAVWGGNQTGVGGNPAPTATTTANATKPNTQQTYPSQNSSNIPSSAESEKPAVGNSVTIAAAEPVEAHQDQQPEVSAGGNDVQIASNLDESNDQPLEPTDQTEHFVTEVRFEVPQSGDDPSAPHLSAIVPTIVVTTLRNSDSSPKAKDTPGQTSPMVRPTASLSASNVNAPHLPVGNSNGNVIGSQPAPPAIPTIMTRIIQVPLLKSASKKPIIPPVLAKTNSQYASGSPDGAAASAAAADNSHQPDARDSPVNTNVNAKSAGPNWINAHWPYIDPSTYFQWTGYKAEDSVLLPALLGFALIGMILIITVCLVARNKRTIVSSVRKRNRNDIEETGAEDNATLLTTTNLSDED